MKAILFSIFYFLIAAVPQARASLPSEEVDKEIGRKAGRIMSGLNIIGDEAFDSGARYASGNSPLIIAWYAISTFLSLFGILVLIAFIYGGWMYMTSQGNEEKVTKATKILLQAAIGVVVILSSLAVAYFVIGIYAEVTDNRFWKGPSRTYDLPPIDEWFD